MIEPEFPGRFCTCGHLKDSHFRQHTTENPAACYYCDCTGVKEMADVAVVTEGGTSRIFVSTKPPLTVSGSCPKCGAVLFGEVKENK